MEDIHRSDGFVLSDDINIFYRRFGIIGKIPIIIVHGLSFFSYDWIAPAEDLASDREVVAIDMRGFGNSEWSGVGKYSLDAHCGDVVAVLDHLRWPRAILFGHSFGGRVCLAATAMHPDRAAALVSVDFAPDLAPKGRRHVAERIGRQPDVFASVDEALEYHGHTDVPQGAPIRARYEAFLRRTDAGFVLRRDTYFRDNFKRALETGKPSAVPEELWDFLRRLSIPALVVRGSESDLFAEETLAKVRAENPEIETVTISGGHDLAGDNPRDLTRAVKAFLDKWNL